MKNIVEIFNEIEDNSLVLLDEVGAGTDPVEGAALATAILDRLNQYNIVTAATTHYSELKIYALTKPGVINGSVEFDVETLSPTYRVLIGVPGKSNAFEISKKLGLKPEVIEQARGLVESNNIEFEDALLKIDRDRKEIEEAKEEILRLQGEQAALKEKIRREERKIAEQKDKILKDAKYEARKLMEATKNESTAIISRLEKYSSDLDKASRKDINDIRDTINQSIKNMSESGYILETHDENQDIRLWDHVFISSLNQKGQVVSEPANDGKVTVQAGALKLNVPINTLKKIKAEVTEEKPKSYRKGFDITNKNIKTSIDLRGMSLEEAFLEIDKYLDDAYLSGLNEVQLIHGKGTGVLRQGIAEFLRKHQLVKDYRLGEFGEGGSGITVVKFK
jgi:DNA mismatch repair protein MutS2